MVFYTHKVVEYALPVNCYDILVATGSRETRTEPTPADGSLLVSVIGKCSASRVGRHDRPIYLVALGTTTLLVGF